MPQYAGMYAGDWSSSQKVRDLVANADVVLDIGGIVTTELNTGMWTGGYDPAKLVSIQDNFVRAGGKVFVNVASAMCSRPCANGCPAAAPITA